MCMIVFLIGQCASELNTAKVSKIHFLAALLNFDSALIMNYRAETAEKTTQ